MNHVIYSNNEVVIVIPNGSDATKTKLLFRGQQMPHIDSMGFYSLPVAHEKSVLDLQFSSTIVKAVKSLNDPFFDFLKFIEDNEPYMTSNKTVSMSDIKMKFLLK